MIRLLGLLWLLVRLLIRLLIGRLCRWLLCRRRRSAERPLLLATHVLALLGLGPALLAGRLLL